MSGLVEAIDKHYELPSPRGVALELMRLAAREDASVADVAKIVQADPALTGRLIHAANGVNAARRTGVLHEAVLRLGFSTIRQLALCFSLVNDYRSGFCTAFDYPAFWTGSLLRAVSAQAVAARVGGFDSQEAFGCGLLAGVGRLALATAQPRAYAELLEHEGSGANLRHAERERFATDHADLSVALLERWNLPEAQVRAVREFLVMLAADDGHSPAGSQGARILVLAEALAQGAVSGSPLGWKQVVLDSAANLDLDADAVNAFAADTVREMSEWAPLLDLPVPAAAMTDYREYEHPGENASGAKQSLRIVLVDDDEADRYLALHALEFAGHSVRAVACGDDALAAIVSELPQMVITDWEMPGMDGVVLCRALRATRFGKDLHVIMYSGRSRGAELVKGIEAGADDFAIKSPDYNVLLARVSVGVKALQRMREKTSEFRKTRHLAVEAAVNAGRSTN